MSTDFVIVGAGSSGCVLASRLTERSERSVLLLEAGPDYHDHAALPLDLSDARRNSMTAHDWGYRHVPTTVQRVFRFPRGRVVGGSSAVNTCIALRGQPEDYDEWSQFAPEWSWEQCLPAFKRLERDLDYPNEPFHGADGPLPIRRHPPREWVPYQAAFVEACRQLGYPSCDDSNRPGSAGVGPHAMNKVDGRRISAAEAYLTASVRARPNFALRPRTLVRRVLFRGRKVAGVEVEAEAGGPPARIDATRVVLCAGAINTPGILVRSGVGPRAEVERLGCDLVADVPAIGRRLLDHPGTAIFLRPRFKSGIERRDPLIQTVLRYASSAAHRSDMLLQPGSKLPLPKLDLPLVSLMCAIGKPRGTGTLHWPSADPRARPIIHSRFLEDAADRALAVDAMARAFELAQARPLARLVAPLWPSPSVLARRDRIDGWIRRACDSGYHPAGTVPFGPASSEAAAADGCGRVRGVEGLYVADASLMPTIPSSNIHLPVLMIGERLAAWLRDE